MISKQYIAREEEKKRRKMLFKSFLFFLSVVYSWYSLFFFFVPHYYSLVHSFQHYVIPGVRPFRATALFLSSSSQQQEQQQQQEQSLFQNTSSDYSKNKDDSSEWILQQGLLLSSFTNGLQNNKAAQHVLRRGLVRTLLLQAIRHTERIVHDSATCSPCCGPTNVSAWTLLEQLDDALYQLDSTNDNNPLEVLPPGFLPVLKVVYIPTAMYALRPDSHNTPGKQRQRARVDAKKRRDELFHFLEELMGPIIIQICTLDWEDGSVKQPQQSSVADNSLHDIPVVGKAVLNNNDWDPHLVYVQGGNTFWLHHCMKKGNWDQDLQKLCQNNAFYIGSSAGSILAGRQMQTACWKGWDDPRVVPGMEQYESWEAVPGLDMVGGHSFFVHYEEDKWSTVVKEKSVSKLVTIRDDEAVYVDGRKRTLNVYDSSCREYNI